MKTVNAIIGGFIASVLLIGVLFKMMHWPGAGPMIVLSSSFLAIFVYLAAAQNIMSYKKDILLKVCNGLGAFVGSIVIIGFLFKIMYWPGAGVMLVVGITLSSFVLLIFIGAFIASKEPFKMSSGTFFSFMAFGILAFGVSVQGPAYSTLKEIVYSYNQTNNILDYNVAELELHTSRSSHAEPYSIAIKDLYSHIENLKSKLIEQTNKLPTEMADTISLENVWGKDNYDVPTQIMGLVEPGFPIKVSGLEEYSGITLREKIQEFNDKMVTLDSVFDPIKTNQQYRDDGGIDSWETATFYHMTLAQVILTLSLIEAEALTKCNYSISKNYSRKSLIKSIN